MSARSRRAPSGLGVAALVELQLRRPRAEWELIETVTTGNPHTDLDFFTQDGETYAAVGTLADRSEPRWADDRQAHRTEGRGRPGVRLGHPSATCISDPAPPRPAARRRGVPQGRHRDQLDRHRPPSAGTPRSSSTPPTPGPLPRPGRARALRGAPLGGLEIVDITDIASPVEIGLTSHIGEAHTVNIDPRRPHIAYAVTSDSVGHENDTTGPHRREQVVTRPRQRFRLDGFEVVDLSSCMNFPDGTSSPQTRAAAGRRSTATATRTWTWRSGTRNRDGGLRLPRARGLPRRPSDLR